MQRASAPESASTIARRIEAAQQGSCADLEYIVRTYRNYLLLVANEELDPGLRGKVEPSDVVQESLLQAQQDIADFRGRTEAELRGWLRQILLHRLLDVHRAFHQTAKRQITREVPLRLGDSTNRGMAPAADGDSPRSELIALEEAALLTAAMRRLPADYRQIIQLRNWERLSFEEIGRKMNRSAAAAGKLWGRALERLQAELDVDDAS